MKQRLEVEEFVVGQLESEGVPGFEDGGAVEACSLPVGVLAPGLRLLKEVLGPRHLFGLRGGVRPDPRRSAGGVVPGQWNRGRRVSTMAPREEGSEAGPCRSRLGSGVEELRRLAERSDAVAQAGGGGPAAVAEAVPGPVDKEEEKESSDSSESRKKKKRKKKKKSFKVKGRKEYGTLFGGTGLDQDPKTRKKVSRLARKAVKKKGKGSKRKGQEQREGWQEQRRRRSRTRRQSGEVTGEEPLDEEEISEELKRVRREMPVRKEGADRP